MIIFYLYLNSRLIFFVQQEFHGFRPVIGRVRGRPVGGRPVRIAGGQRQFGRRRAQVEQAARLFVGAASARAAAAAAHHKRRRRRSRHIRIQVGLEQAGPVVRTRHDSGGGRPRLQGRATAGCRQCRWRRQSATAMMFVVHEAPARRVPVRRRGLRGQRRFFTPVGRRDRRSPRDGRRGRRRVGPTVAAGRCCRLRRGRPAGGGVVVLFCLLFLLVLVAPAAQPAQREPLEKSAQLAADRFRLDGHGGRGRVDFGCRRSRTHCCTVPVIGVGATAARSRRGTGGRRSRADGGRGDDPMRQWWGAARDEVEPLAQLLFFRHTRTPVLRRQTGQQFHHHRVDVLVGLVRVRLPPAVVVVVVVLVFRFRFRPVVRRAAWVSGAAALAAGAGAEALAPVHFGHDGAKVHAPGGGRRRGQAHEAGGDEQVVAGARRRRAQGRLALVVYAL